MNVGSDCLGDCDGEPADVVGLIDDDKDFCVIGEEFVEELA
ncbi:hypothetical protein FRC0087_01916 [Corynebacterium diphtheriae]|nr:hypothetical protein FRC0087_01916 [Corynebacterium diphtheriae]CAB0916494.1 hypothetical protein FRC0410_01974 [Corynebacterium diphtheriae]